MKFDFGFFKYPEVVLSSIGKGGANDFLSCFIYNQLVF